MGDENQRSDARLKILFQPECMMVYCFQSDLVRIKVKALTSHRTTKLRNAEALHEIIEAWI